MRIKFLYFWGWKGLPWSWPSAFTRSLSHIAL